jgi:endonuclease/exonuclease/phosphatase family metal-dependent hydrolase
METCNFVAPCCQTGLGVGKLLVATRLGKETEGPASAARQRRGRPRLRQLWALSVSLACGDPFHASFADVEPAVSYTRHDALAAPAPVGALRLMNYNLKFGGGRLDFFFDCHGDRVLMTRAEVALHLEGLATKIRQVDPDLLFVQEVDVSSKRAAFVDELQWLLDHTRLSYAYYASQWKADYVPSDGLGAVDSGNAILSKYPLRNGTRIALTRRRDQSAIERYFYLRRNLLTAELAVPGHAPIRLVTVHTEAYAKDGTKLAHIERFKTELDTWASAGQLVVGAGDLNTLPPGTAQLSGFDDSACTEDFEADDYTSETTWLEPLYAEYAPETPLLEYQADNAPFFSHTTRGDGFWNRKLDYLFTNGQFAPGSALTHQDGGSGGSETMPLSDHAPISVTLELP